MIGGLSANNRIGITNNEPKNKEFQTAIPRNEVTAGLLSPGK